MCVRTVRDYVSKEGRKRSVRLRIYTREDVLRKVEEGKIAVHPTV